MGKREEEKKPCPMLLTVKLDGNSLYFEEYHISNKQLTDDLINNLGLDMSKI